MTHYRLPTHTRRQFNRPQIPHDLPPTSFRRPAAAEDHEYLRIASGRLRRMSQGEYNPQVYPNWSASMWVDVSRERPTQTVNPYTLHDGGDLALLTVGWAGAVEAMHATVPDVVTTLVLVDPIYVNAPPQARTLCAGPPVRSPRQALHDPARRWFDLATESTWFHCAMTLAEQLGHILAGRTPVGWCPQEIPTPALGFVEPGLPEPPDNTPGPTIITDASEVDPKILEGKEFLWMVGGMRQENAEYDPVDDVVRRVKWCSPWGVTSQNVLHPLWEFSTVTVRYDLRAGRV